MRRAMLILTSFGCASLPTAAQNGSPFDDTAVKVEINAASDNALECKPIVHPILTRPTASSDFFKACVRAYADLKNIDIDDVNKYLKQMAVIQTDAEHGYVFRIVEHDDT